jgi:hypothetical protein
MCPYLSIFFQKKILPQPIAATFMDTSGHDPLARVASRYSHVGGISHPPRRIDALLIVTRFPRLRIHTRAIEQRSVMAALFASSCVVK